MIKNYKKVLSIALMIFCEGALLQAQVLEGLEGQTNLQMVGGSGLSARTFDNRYDGVDGFPTFVKDFVKGRIMMNKEQVVKIDNMNYDVFNDEIFVIRGGKELVVSRDMVHSFVMDVNGTALTFYKKKSNEGKVGYYQIVTTGKFSLFIKHSKVFRKADYQGAYSANRTKDEFTNEQKFYWSKGDSNLILLKNKKSLISGLGDSAAKAELLIKVNNLKMDSQDHLSLLFQHLNEP
ncbi:hypothetical protein SanaruYs_09090 [Chryseotalea sanaruensis]|uniref:Uncharacterized protein n=1 Tax=Chryseotalea sanaruensis TaxID=2482724 RepID=A0A401U6Y0_9BACT|nr:hypothetical protein [Chryseotalea sanaruensis]GCC50691.1 hypothetical protein SanaruYs_09090 [Chryseotalea sanaruensis]